MTAAKSVFILILCAATTLSATAGEIARISRSTVAVREEFERLDVDGNERIQLDEFLRRPGNASVLRRDFRLYDLDEDESLSRREFGSVWGLTRPAFRRAMPDPWEDVVADAIAALDESYDHWDQRPDESINAHLFVANFIGSISLGGKRFVTGRIVRQADRDSDGQLSRAEAGGFLRHQLGMRWQFFHHLREPSGRMLRFDRFLEVDRDADDSLTPLEFHAHWWNPGRAEADFKKNDRNGNGRITLMEYAYYESDNYFDPVEWFRAADTDLDARLDGDEMLKASGASRRHLVASSIAAFDDDGDGGLSLQEYRLTMHANVNYSWDRPVSDTNGDGWISYDEFVFNDIDLFQLQRRYYFHRLDRDQNGRLSRDEFSF